MDNSAKAIAERVIRRHKDVARNLRISVLPNQYEMNGKIELVGRYGHYENARGDLVRYPNAYRRAFGKPIYICSTKCIELNQSTYDEIVKAAELGKEYRDKLRRLGNRCNRKKCFK